MDNFYLYIAIFSNNKKYIGITNNFNIRISHHKYNSSHYKYNYKFYNAINKYGFENIGWIVVDGYTDWSELQKIEINEIARYNTTDTNFGYNTTEGGEGTLGLQWTEEQRLQMSKRMSGPNHPFYGKARPEMSKRMSGENNPMYGKSGELSPCFGLIKSDDFKEKRSKAMMGENNPMYGKTYKKDPKLIQWGENHPKCKITDAQIIEIREKYFSGKFLKKELAKIFNVHRNVIGWIINKKGRFSN